MSTMDLNTIKSSISTQSGDFAPLADDILDLRDCPRPWFVERISSPGDLQLDVARTDGARIQSRTSLSSRMAQLRDKHTDILLRHISQSSRSCNPIVVVVTQNRVAVSFQSILANHHIASDYDSDLALAPALV